MTKFDHILFATDFTESSRRALAVAADLALQLDAALTVVHAYEPLADAYPGVVFLPGDITPVEEAVDQAMEAELLALRARVPRVEGMLRRGVPWEQVQAAIEETEASLVVMGTSSRHGLSRAILGSVAEKTVRMSTIPVLVVPAQAAQLGRESTSPSSQTS